MVDRERRREASTPPAAPSRCPVIDFVDDTASFPRMLPEHPLDGQRLELVVVGVEVPWALM